MQNKSKSKQGAKLSKGKGKNDSRERNNEIQDAKNNRKYMPNLQIQRQAKIRLPPPVKNLDVTQKQKIVSKKTYNRKNQMQNKNYATPCKTNKSDKTVTNDYHTVSISQRVKPIKNQQVIALTNEFNVHRDEKNIGTRQNNHQAVQPHLKKDSLVNPQTQKQKMMKNADLRYRKVIKQASPSSQEQINNENFKLKIQSQL